MRNKNPIKTLYTPDEWCELCDSIEHSVDEVSWGITGETYNAILLVIFDCESKARDRLLRGIRINDNSELETLYKVLFEDLNRVPLYINTSFSPIAHWRLKNNK